MSRPLLRDLRIKNAPTTSRPEEPTELPSKYEEKEDSKFASVYESGLPASSLAGRSRYGLWVVAIASVAFLLFALSFLFTKAKIVVTPKVVDVVLSESLSALLGGDDSSSLSFDLVVVSGQEERIIPVVGEEEISVPATGRVVIYNSYSAAAQPLAIETRLEGSNGKIYKTDIKLVVPGMEGNAPGSVEVGVHAAEPGPEYDSGPLDFNIVGFSGTPKYGKFYARSKGEMTGGFIGKRGVVSEEEKTQALIDLKSSLQKKLFEKANNQLPEGFLMFPDGSMLDAPESSGEVTVAGNQATVSLGGTLSGIIFKEEELAMKIAGSVIPGYGGSRVFMPEMRNLKFSLSPQIVPLKEAKSVVFHLAGPARVVFRVDSEKIAEEVAGRRKSDFNQILSGYPSIVSAELTLRPFWKRVFPEKSADIEVVVNYPK